MQQSVRPIVEAGLMTLVESEHEVCAEVRLIPTPGHTPGHVSVLIESGGQQALITGDFIHHPVQMSRPEWCSSADSDPQVGLTTRKKVLADYVDSDVLIIGTHFPTPTAGYVRPLPDGDNYWLDVGEH
jgi:glyoxylase-like metal-dependent hydrolase (beta-lactamase superfamily II)